jgi:quinol monooxygenase YgiN
MQNIILHVTYTCFPGKAEEFVTALKESGFQTTVRAEDGCLQYDYHLSCEEKDTVVLIECWRDAAALAAHAAAPHMARVAAMKEGRVKETNLKRYE